MLSIADHLSWLLFLRICEQVFRAELFGWKPGLQGGMTNNVKSTSELR